MIFVKNSRGGREVNMINCVKNRVGGRGVNLNVFKFTVFLDYPLVIQ